MKRTLYDLDDISDQSHKDKLTQGLKDAVTIVAKALEKIDDPQYLPKLEYWFGDQHSDANGRETIRQVFKNLVGDNTDGTGSNTNGNVFVFTADYWKPTDAQIPNAGTDGTIPFCTLNQNGKSGTAYFKRTDDKKPAMHFCDKVWDRADLATLTADSCSSLGNQISMVAWSKNFFGANVLHEYMYVVDVKIRSRKVTKEHLCRHYPRIGKDAVGTQIADVLYDAFRKKSCHLLYMCC